MENTKTSEGRGTLELIVQLITAAAVFAGIYFVMIELRQGREISTVEMIHKRMITNIEHDSKIYGEDMSDALVKACLYPDELTNSEATRLNYYFQSRMTQIYIAYTGAILGTYQKGIGLVENWEFLGSAYINDILSYPSGRAWIQNQPRFRNLELAKTDEVVAFVQYRTGEPLAQEFDKKKLVTSSV